MVLMNSRNFYLLCICHKQIIPGHFAREPLSANMNKKIELYIMHCYIIICSNHTQIIYDTWQNFLSAFKLPSLSYEVVHPRLGRNTKDTLGTKKKEERASDKRELRTPYAKTR